MRKKKSSGEMATRMMMYGEVASSIPYFFKGVRIDPGLTGWDLDLGFRIFCSHLDFGCGEVMNTIRQGFRPSLLPLVRQALGRVYQGMDYRGQSLIGLVGEWFGYLSASYAAPSSVSVSCVGLVGFGGAFPAFGGGGGGVALAAGAESSSLLFCSSSWK